MLLPISKIFSFLLVSLTIMQVHAQQKAEPRAVEPVRTIVITRNLENVVSAQQVANLAALKALKDLPSGQLLALGEPLPLRTGVEFLEQDPGDKVICTQPEQPFASTLNKKISRSFKVNSADKLSIDNQFGTVEVQTWGKNEILVEVMLQANAVTESKAQEIMDHINIRIAETGNLISFVTERQAMQIRSSSEKSFEINYLVRMPKGNPLRVYNKYGSVQLPDMDGPVELAVKYGKFTTGNLNNRANSLEVQYSSGLCQTASMKGGDINIRYSSFLLNNADVLQSSTAYSKIEIGKVDALTIESKYDQSFKIGSAGRISGTGSYSTFIINHLKESAGMEMKYSKFVVGNIALNFNKIQVNGGYTGIVLGFADGSAFNFDIATQYSGVKMNQDLADFNFREVRNTSAAYRGKYGKASPKGSVNITSRYGSVQFN